MLNAAVWLGATAFHLFAAAPAMHSAELKQLLGSANAPYFGGALAQMLAARMAVVHVLCGSVAVVQVVAEWLYLGRVQRRLWLGILASVILITLFEGVVLEPRLKRLHLVAHATNLAPAQREAGAEKLSFWRAITYGGNLLVLTGLGLYFWRLANPPPATRFVSSVKFRS